MNTKLPITLVVALVLFTGANSAHAQMMSGDSGSRMMGNFATTSISDIAGSLLWERFSSGQVTCDQLTEDDFDILGDYFMGNMLGSAHSYADQQMTEKLGELGEQQMHIAMGKRISGCNLSAAYPTGTNEFFPLIGGETSIFHQILDWLPNILVWILAVIGAVSSVQFLLSKQNHRRTRA